MTDRLKKVLAWLKENNYNGWQWFSNYNDVGDPTYIVYNEDEVLVEACPYYDYIEILGLSQEEIAAIGNERKAIVL